MELMHLEWHGEGFMEGEEILQESTSEIPGLMRYSYCGWNGIRSSEFLISG